MFVVQGSPFGQMPILEVDGVKLCQSNACARYLARKFSKSCIYTYCVNANKSVSVNALTQYIHVDPYIHEDDKHTNTYRLHFRFYAVFLKINPVQHFSTLYFFCLSIYLLIHSVN